MPLTVFNSLTCWNPISAAPLATVTKEPPVTSTPKLPLPEAVEDSVSGYLVPPLDVEAWGEALGRLESDTESERLGRGAGELWARHYSPERGLDALEAAYRDAMAARG